ncbi:MAG: hypothetical protein JO276_06450 [Sphingomonadaceae bacterium]|nr:hypothetical protein [Sphingomonadaceae bacterium]
MNLRLILTAALLGAASFPAVAQTGSPGPTGDSAADASRRICRVTPRVGSRLGGTRTCRTKAEWDAADRENREAVNRYQRTTSFCMMGPNDPSMAGGPHLVCSADGP